MTMKSTLKAILGSATIALVAAGCIDDPVQVGRIEDRAGASGTLSDGGANGGSITAIGGANPTGGSGEAAATGGAAAKGGTGGVSTGDQKSGGTSNVGSPGCHGAVVLGGLPILPTGQQPGSVVLGDFNLDGKPDLATANPSWGTTGPAVSVLLGHGDGSFAPKVDYGISGTPTSIMVGDFNLDGKPDLVVVTVGSRGLSLTIPSIVGVLLGNGDGTFGPEVDQYTSLLLDAAAVGDFNGDGQLDLAAANTGSSTVSVLFGNGDGSFAATMDYIPGGIPALGDFNLDEEADLVVANGTVAVLLQDCTGPMVMGTPLGTGGTSGVGATTGDAGTGGTGRCPGTGGPAMVGLPEGYCVEQHGGHPGRLPAVARHQFVHDRAEHRLHLEHDVPAGRGLHAVVRLSLLASANADRISPVSEDVCKLEVRDVRK